MRYAQRMQDEEAIAHVARLAKMFEKIKKLGQNYAGGIFLCEGCFF